MTEDAMLDCFTVAELAALARFYGPPEDRSAARKALAFTAAVTPKYESEILAWGRGAAAEGFARTS